MVRWFFSLAVVVGFPMGVVGGSLAFRCCVLFFVSFIILTCFLMVPMFLTLYELPKFSLIFISFPLVFVSGSLVSA